LCFVVPLGCLRSRTLSLRCLALSAVLDGCRVAYGPRAPEPPVQDTIEITPGACFRAWLAHARSMRCRWRWWRVRTKTQYTPTPGRDPKIFRKR